MSEVDPRLGTTVSGKYRLESLLGRGGMGVVYLAVHVELGEPVALKFLHPWAESPELVARFKREAVALARLRHPGVVSLLEFGEEEGKRFLVMEYVKGETLASVLDRAPLPLPTLYRVFDGLLDVLEVAHAAGIVHRDLKSSNVMLLPQDRVKVLDFGLARLPEAEGEKLTASGLVQGTPEYMSPEQCHGEPAGAASDVYSAGVMLYEAIAGHTPFDSGGHAEIMARHMFLDPPPPERAGAATPRGLERLVLEALAKDPEARPTATELRRALGFVARGTDEATLFEAAAKERGRLAGLDRSERAFTGRRDRDPDAPVSVRAERARVEVSVAAAHRSAAVSTALAMAGLRVVRDDAEADVVLLSMRDEDFAARVAAVRARRPATPLLVVDVASPGEVTRAIRAGAADVLLAADPDTELPKRISRLRRPRG